MNRRNLIMSAIAGACSLLIPKSWRRPVDKKKYVYPAGPNNVFLPGTTPDRFATDLHRVQDLKVLKWVQVQTPHGTYLRAEVEGVINPEEQPNEQAK